MEQSILKDVKKAFEANPAIDAVYVGDKGTVYTDKNKAVDAKRYQIVRRDQIDLLIAQELEATKTKTKGETV